VVLRRDQRSGSYIVEDLGSAASVAAAARSEAASVISLRPAEVAPASTTAVAAAASTESTDANGRPRRRRGRGRGRGRAAAAPGAYPDASAPAAEFDDHDESDDHDDGPEGEDSAADGPDPGSAFSERDAERAEPALSKAEGESPAEPAPNPEKPSFSLFSWIRRESSSSPTPGSDKPGPEES